MMNKSVDFVVGERRRKRRKESEGMRAFLWEQTGIVQVSEMQM